MPLDDLNPRFRSLTAALLEELPDASLPDAVQQHVFIKIGEQPEREAEILASLPGSVQAVYASMIVDAQVQNGGFNQFFWNSARFADLALKGLEELGAHEHARVLRQAMEVAIAERDRLLPYHVEGSIQAFSGSYREGVFDDLDTLYYNLPALDGILARSIRDHPERFASP